MVDKDKKVKNQEAENEKADSMSKTSGAEDKPKAVHHEKVESAKVEENKAADTGSGSVDVLAEADKSEARPAAKRSKIKQGQYVSSGIVHINATFNNTQVTISDKKGAVIAWSSGGRLGFAGTKKSSAYAATMVAQDAARQAASYKLQDVDVRVQGPGAGRESAIRALQSAGLNINVIIDVTPVPHNGCRPRKRRRV